MILRKVKQRVKERKREVPIFLPNDLTESKLNMGNYASVLDFKFEVLLYSLMLNGTMHHP